MKTLKTPALIVWGTDDIYFDVKWAYWLSENIPGTRRRIEFEGARIFSPEERWEAFNSELRNQAGGAAMKPCGQTHRTLLCMLIETLSIRIEHLQTPIGELLIVTDRRGNLRAVDWTGCEERMHRLLQIQCGVTGFKIERNQVCSKAAAALERYFQGELAAIDDLPVETGGTVFQRDVWRALRDIPCGSTTSYSALAKQIGRPAAIRAVGAANGCNPVSIVVPCHRVIGCDGSLTGYAGGVERKQWLLKHEAGACRS